MIGEFVLNCIYLDRGPLMLSSYSVSVHRTSVKYCYHLLWASRVVCKRFLKEKFIVKFFVKGCCDWFLEIITNRKTDSIDDIDTGNQHLHILFSPPLSRHYSSNLSSYLSISRPIKFPSSVASVERAFEKDE